MSGLTCDEFKSLVYEDYQHECRLAMSRATVVFRNLKPGESKMITLIPRLRVRISRDSENFEVEL